MKAHTEAQRHGGGEKTTENEISGDVLDAAIKIHKPFGPGMLESVCKTLPVFAKQVKTFLVVLKLHLGLVVNFGLATVKDGFVRIVNGFNGLFRVSV